MWFAQKKKKRKQDKQRTNNWDIKQKANKSCDSATSSLDLCLRLYFELGLGLNLPFTCAMRELGHSYKPPHKWLKGVCYNTKAKKC